VKSFVFSMMMAVAIIYCPAQAPVIRARLVPAKGIIVGQPVHLTIEVLVPNFFTGSPDFPTFDLEDAIVVLSEDTPANMSEQISGQTYAGISRTYLIYPQQAGNFKLPPAQFTVPYAKSPPKTAQAVLTLPPLTFHADIPAAARGLDYFLPTTRLTMQQKWSAPLNKLRVGDTVERTIMITALRMQGMLIPPMQLQAPNGIRIYPDEPKVQDQKTDRGEFIFGSRLESAKYFIQKEGDYTLPAIELRWWNLSSNRLVTATIPAVHFTATPNPSYVAELPPEPEVVTTAQPRPASLWSRYRWIVTAAPVLCLAIASVWFAYSYLPKLVIILMRRRERYLRSESAYFRNLVRACRNDQPQGAYQWLLHWLENSNPKETLNHFLERCEDEQLTQQIDALAETLFGKDPVNVWNGTVMARRLREHRKAASSRRESQTRLPLLNP
jgi:hypothetical protein